jgi:hypothetical protein
MDEPLFVWTAQHIAGHPLDPYGFRVVWYATETPVSASPRIRRWLPTTPPSREA